MSTSIINVAASIRQRLLNLARVRNEDFGVLLTKYALERLLFRISQSEHKLTFILKGALLFELWTKQTHRPTRDADFLFIGSSDPRRFEDLFKGICVLPVVDDGLPNRDGGQRRRPATIRRRDRRRRTQEHFRREADRPLVAPCPHGPRRDYTRDTGGLVGRSQADFRSQAIEGNKKKPAVVTAAARKEAPRKKAA